MALTQVKTSGLADDAVTSAKIADDAVIVDAIANNAVQTDQINAGAVTGNKIADDTVLEANMANNAIGLAELKGGTDGTIISFDANGDPKAIGPGTDGQVLTSAGAGAEPAFETLPASNNYTHPNHSGEVTSTGDGATVIADDVVDEANLKVSNSPTNGYFLSAQSGNTGGLTWAEAGGGLDGVTTGSGNVSITDGNLIIATAGHGIDFSAQGDDATNMSSELFDDYEEGWFTPTCTNAITLDAYNDRLYYRKIGNTCTIGGRLIVDNGQSGGVLNFSGLPFAHADDGDGTNRTLDHFFFHDWSQLHSNWDDSLCAFYQIHSTNMNLYIRNSSGDWTYFHPYDDGQINFNITYPTT